MFASSILTENRNSPSPRKTVTNPSQGSHIMSYILKFFPRKGKQKAGMRTCPLYLRISCNGVRVEVSLNKWIEPGKWNPKAQRLVGNSPEAKAINEFVKSVEVKLHNIHTSLLNKGDVISAEVLKAHLLGQTGKQKTVLEAFDYHIRHNGKAYSIATLKKYGYCRTHLKNFIWKSFSTTDVFLQRVELPFVREFHSYLNEECQFNDENGKLVHKVANDHNSTLKYVKMFKTVISNAVAYKWLESNPFALYREKYEAVEQESLDETELTKILETDIPIERLSLVRDLFVFSCFTGLAYADLKKLSMEHIVIGIDGHKWINIKRTKTNTVCKIPLLPAAETILRKFVSNPICINTGKLLPVCSNQKLNKYLKEIADLSGINKNLTCHVARRTFTTVAVENGVPADTIIRIIGHSTYKHLHLYAKTGERKLAEDMKILRTKKFGDCSYENCEAVPQSM